MKIAILTTGGTFDKVYFDANSEYSIGEPCISSILDEGNVTSDYRVQSILKKDRPNSYNGKAIICGAKIIPIGGHRLKSKWKPEEDNFSDFKIFFGRTVSGVLFPVRVDLERWFGTITVRLLNSDI